jgi:hypothetical protein
MHVNKRLITAFLVLLTPLLLMAQQSNSPYSRFGYGVLEPATFGQTKGMGGVGISIRENNMINAANPASYSAIDTMTMLFDFGLNTSTSLFKQGSAAMSTTNGGLDYVSMKIPLKPWWGTAIGLYPLSKVGYTYSFDNELNNGDTYTGTYTGSGGLNAVFLGTAVSLGKHVSLGANYKYISGQITQTSYEDFNSSDIRNVSVSESWYLNGSAFDLGVQYKQAIDARNEFVLGATFSENAPLNNSVYKISVSTDTSSSSTSSDFSVPRTIGLGASWVYDKRLTVALDVNKQLWSDAYFNGAVDSLSDMTRVSFGIEYLPSFASNRYYKAVKYRLGCNYSDSYIRNDMGNLRNLGVTLGFGLPLNMNSALNVAFELGKVIPPATSLISETYFKVSLAMTFNETWFFKRKL